MKSCKGIKTNLGNVTGNRLCNEKRNNFPYAVKKMQKITAKLYEKMLKQIWEHVLVNRKCNQKNETISLMLWRKFKNNRKVVKALKQI